MVCYKELMRVAGDLHFLILATVILGGLMHRRFCTAPCRSQQYLDGFWDAVFDPDDVGLQQGWYETFPSNSMQIWVPGVWNTRAGRLNYEGAVWYRRQFVLDECRAARLDFFGVTHQANVWLDGEPLGDHYGGFLPFSFDLLDPSPGLHEVIVRVDNTHDMNNTIPSSHLDWFRYGGIFRPVLVEQMQSEAIVSTLRLIPDLDGGTGRLAVRAQIENLLPRPLTAEWSISIDGEPVRQDAVRIEARGEAVVRFALDVPEVESWIVTIPDCTWWA